MDNISNSEEEHPLFQAGSFSRFLLCMTDIPRSGSTNNQILVVIGWDFLCEGKTLLLTAGENDSFVSLRVIGVTK
jgi:hypothetical protein